MIGFSIAVALWLIAIAVCVLWAVCAWRCNDWPMLPLPLGMGTFYAFALWQMWVLP